MATIAGKLAWERIIQAIKTGDKPKASDFKILAESQQGWHPTATSTGPLKYVDKNGVIRVTLKQGSNRTPGSDRPHVELRNAKGSRIDLQGKPVTRKSLDNNTPISYSLGHLIMQHLNYWEFNGFENVYLEDSIELAKSKQRSRLSPNT
ncbi:hypothetical protein [Kamptonema sp. UHCC 0994]|uniref:hypothetical protein n=1 Tax=Kamptonema sp. UHCC 0994 TaxID=3031329 RepID=UPI0023B88644|nr:hypothetical protein [Kamptonema sp. UHCC 0994]MDF0554985.1 hypothetical protein [Kamptonema sp. UHCC 0994]